ncbi:MAG: pyruvate dehydrogenase (acetyl-transferring) E1 component subunit alpha, partial [Gemmatimonadetes bacterium]|nr:pyruvate dehydrogenase (acetyl-transferring) E1 component subunit alpha [Gemmatimonadota bacterium]
IALFVSRLKEAELVEDAEVEAIDRAVRAEAEAAVEFARSSPHPSPEDLYKDVYVAGERDPRRRRDPWR